MLDPKTLTPESLYSLQSETYAKGYLAGAYDERLRLVELAKSYKNKPAFTIDNLISLMLNGAQK